MKKSAFYWLAVAGSVVGGGFLLPLWHTLGSQGMGMLTVALAIYCMCLVYSCGGGQNTLCKHLKDAMLLGDYSGAAREFKRALVINGGAGLLGALAVFMLALPVQRLTGFWGLDAVLIVTAPVVLITALQTPFRGYYKAMDYGFGDVALFLSQLLKGVLMLVLGGLGAMESPEKGAAGAAAGLLIGEAAALALLAAPYMLLKEQLWVRAQISPLFSPQSWKTSLKNWLEGVLAALGLGAYPLAVLMDLTLGGLTPEAFALADGLSLAVCAFVPMLMGPLLAVAIQKTQWALEDEPNADSRPVGAATLKLAAAVCLPLCAVFMALGEPILDMVFVGAISFEQVAQAGQTLELLALGGLFLGLSVPAALILQYSGHTRAAFGAVAMGLSIKAGVLLLLTRLGFTELALPLGTAAMLVAAGLFCLFYLAWTLDMSVSLGTWAKQGIASAVMGVVVYIGYTAYARQTWGVMMGTAAALGAALVFYLAAMTVLGGVDKKDMELMLNANSRY